MKRTSIRFVGAGCLLSMAACAGPDTTNVSTGATTSTIEVHLVDAPCDVAELFARPVQIGVHGLGGWHSKSVSVGDIDIASLQRGTFSALGTLNLPTGTYNQIVIELDGSAHATLKSQEQVAVDVPSGQLHISGRFEIKDGFSTRITVDFDVCDSIHEAGKSGKWEMHPSYRLKSVEFVPIGGPDPRDSEYTAKIGPSGGDVFLMGGSGLVVPPGAVSTETDITIKALPSDVSTIVEDGSYGVFRGGLEVLPHGLTLSEPAMLVVVPNSPLEPGSSVLPVVQDPAGIWRIDPNAVTSVDLAGRAQIQLFGFSRHGAAEVEDIQRNYHGDSAAKYALKYWDWNNPTSQLANPFPDFETIGSNNNCTAFVSQSLIAGLMRTDSSSTVWDSRYAFDADKGSQFSWYFHNLNDRGTAFTSANQLYNYAKASDTEYKSNAKFDYRGMHFKYITNDTPTQFFDQVVPGSTDMIEVGDIVFADWGCECQKADYNCTCDELVCTGPDGTIDHTMLVTNIDNLPVSGAGYNRIELTYQSTNRKNKKLGEINECHKYMSLFSVYRPVDYDPNGL